MGVNVLGGIYVLYISREISIEHPSVGLASLTQICLAEMIGLAKQAPHWGVQSRFLVILCACVCRGPKRRRNYVGQTRACSKSVLGGKIQPVTPALFISTIR